MFPTACHETPSSRLTAVRSVICARYAAISSSVSVNALLLVAHDTCSTRTPHCPHDTRHGAYSTSTGVRPHGTWRHRRNGWRSYRGARSPHAPQRDRRHDGRTPTANSPDFPTYASRTCIRVTPSSRRSTVVRRMGSPPHWWSSATPNETRKPLRPATARRPPLPTHAPSGRCTAAACLNRILALPVGSPAGSWLPATTSHSRPVGGGSPHGPERSGGAAFAPLDAPPTGRAPHPRGHASNVAPRRR